MQQNKECRQNFTSNLVLGMVVMAAGSLLLALNGDCQCLCLHYEILSAFFHPSEPAFNIQVWNIFTSDIQYHSFQSLTQHQCQHQELAPVHPLVCFAPVPICGHSASVHKNLT
jgi:hypothetical protein